MRDPKEYIMINKSVSHKVSGCFVVLHVAAILCFKLCAYSTPIILFLAATGKFHALLFIEHISWFSFQVMNSVDWSFIKTLILFTENAERSFCVI